MIELNSLELALKLLPYTSIREIRCHGIVIIWDGSVGIPQIKQEEIDVLSTVGELLESLAVKSGGRLKYDGIDSAKTPRFRIWKERAKDNKWPMYYNKTSYD